jgi:hypothetical protein
MVRLKHEDTLDMDKISRIDIVDKQTKPYRQILKNLVKPNYGFE